MKVLFTLSEPTPKQELAGRQILYYYKDKYLIDTVEFQLNNSVYVGDPDDLTEVKRFLTLSYIPEKVSDAARAYLENKPSLDPFKI